MAMDYKSIRNYGGAIIEKYHKSKADAMHLYAGWYNHGLDMFGQVSPNTIDIYHGDKCILSDRM